MTTNNINFSSDPNAYKMGWEKAQKGLEAYVQAQYRSKTKKAIEKLKNGETFIDLIEAA